MDAAAALNVAATAAASMQALADALQNNGPNIKLLLPQFWTHDPVGWFHHIEAEFVIARIPANSYLCYLHVVRALPSEVITAVADLTGAINPTTPNAYELFKQALLNRFTASPLQKCFQLLDHPMLGDGNIPALYSKMRSLLPTNGDIPFNAMFLRRLPDHLQTALAAQGELPSGELAAAATLLQHTVSPTAAIAAATPLPPSPPPATVASVSQQHHHHRRTSRSPGPRCRFSTPHRRSDTHQRRPPSRNRRPPPHSTLCFYHYNFGAKSTKCQDPCTWEN